MRLSSVIAGNVATSIVARAQRTRAFCAGAALCGALLVGGCESYVGARAVTVHGKHGHKTCVQLLAEHKATSARIDELSGLQDAAGLFIGTTVYGTTLAQARGERRILDEAIEEKRCR